MTKNDQITNMSSIAWFVCILFFATINVIQVQCNYPGMYGPGYGMPYPVMMGGYDDDDGWKSILPILLLMMSDGGFGGYGGYGYGNGCGCSGCGRGGCCNSNSGSTIPIPYPIPIPVNNPIIT